MLTYKFWKEAHFFHDWLDELLQSIWEASEETELLIESPSTIGGIHVAQKLQIPYFRQMPFLWSKTKYYPNPFAVPGTNLGINHSSCFF